MNAEQRLLRAAQDAGLVPAGQPALPAGPSWVVTAVGYIGALLVALLGLGVLALLSWGHIFSMPGSLIASLAFTAGGIGLLRATRTLFLQQLAFSALLIGQAMWLVSWGGHWDFTSRAGIVLPLLGLLGLQLAAAWLTPGTWVVRLLGLIAAWTFLVTPLSFAAGGDALELLWRGAALHLNAWILALAWAAWCILQPRCSGRPWTLRASALADGAAVALLLQPLMGYGASWGAARFLQAASGEPAALFQFDVVVAVRMALVIASAAWLAHHWRPAGHPAVRRAWPLLALVYAALLLACWFMPVESVAVVASVALGTGRRRLLWLALAALLLLLANFYYLLAWSLMDKARVLLAAGVGLAGLLIGLRALRGGAGEAPANRAPEALAPAPRRRGWAAAAMLVTAAVALGLVQWDVRHKEQVIAQGQKVFVRLAPVDPRSLMQGDYMALNFALPAGVSQQLGALPKDGLSATRHVAARLDARGVAQLLRLAAPGEPLLDGEVLLPLRYLKGRWSLVTDAYFFPEGQAQRFSRAFYGDFRVLPGGRALLVGLADEQLAPIEPTLAPAGAAPSAPAR